MVANNYYSLCFLVFMLGRFASTLFLRWVKATRLLIIYIQLSIMLLLMTIILSGVWAIYSLIAVNFFISTMYPTIFSLSLRQVTEDVKIAASLLVMAIIGGAIFPPMFGLIGDFYNNAVYGLIVPILCFSYIAFFTLRGHVVNASRLKQG